MVPNVCCLLFYFILFYFSSFYLFIYFLKHKQAKIKVNRRRFVSFADVSRNHY